MAHNWSTSTRRSRLPGSWPLLRRTVLERDNGLCQIRGPRCTRIATAVDHIQHGDNHNLTNLQAVCNTCHRVKTQHESHQTRVTRRRPDERHPGVIR